MTRKFIRVLAATTALTAAFPAFAQDAQADEAVAVDEGEIIVTARRSDERLQDVPVSVQVVSGESLQKLAVTSADEISKLAPGLTLTNAGASSVVVLRGVTWQPGSGTPATPIYFNEVPFGPAETLQALFDIGQIEVLRGPQGTSRGAPSISGAVTITTRKPDLTEFGGFVQGLYGSGDHTDFQGAINVPLIKDMLAIRLAGNIEDSDGNRVYSVNSRVQPKLKDRTYRATVLFKPTDTLSLQAMYQRRSTHKSFLYPGDWPWQPGPLPRHFSIQRASGPTSTARPLTVAQRASVQDLPSTVDERGNLLTINAGWEVLGQKLTYNYGNSFNRDKASFSSR